LAVIINRMTSEHYYTIDYKLVRMMAEVFYDETEDCEKAATLVRTSVGDTQNAHRLILNDHVWRLQDKIGKLWLYVSGSADFEPIIRDQMNKEKDKADKKAIEEREAKKAENVVVPTINEQSA